MWVIRYWKPLCGLLIAAALYGWGYFNARTAGLVALQVERNRAERIIADYAKAEAEAKSKAWAKEREMLDYVTELGRRHEQELKEGQERANRTVADLRSGNLRLKRLWESGRATDRLSDTAAATRQSEQIAQLRAEAIGRVRGIGAEADAQVRGLQEAYESVRTQPEHGGGLN